MSFTPRLYVGDYESGDIMLFNSTSVDDDQQFQVRALTARVAPAGAGGECIFTSLYLTVTHDLVTDDVDLTVTPVLDGATLDGAGGNPDERTTVTLAVQGTPARVTEVFEVGLSIPNTFNQAQTEQGRNAMRGTWMQVLIESGAALDSGDGEIILESVEVEYEVVQESHVAV